MLWPQELSTSHPHFGDCKGFWNRYLPTVASVSRRRWSAKWTSIWISLVSLQSLSTTCPLKLAALDNHAEIHLLSLDVSNTFDRIWHEGLLSKLSLFGFHPAFVTRISFSQEPGPFQSPRFSLNADIPRDTITASVLWFLVIKDLLTSHFKAVHCLDDYAIFHWSHFYSRVRQATATADHDRTVLGVSPACHLGQVSVRNSTCHLYFNRSWIFLFSVRLKHLPCSLQLNLDWSSFHSTESFSVLGLSINSIHRYSLVLTLTSGAEHKFGFIFLAKRVFSTLSLSFTQLISADTSVLQSCVERSFATLSPWSGSTKIRSV